MEKRYTFREILLKSLGYLGVAVLASVITMALMTRTSEGAKVNQLRNLIRERFIGEVSDTALEDGAAAGMVSALGDRWSYYIPASEYEAHMEGMNNAYVGIGVTIQVREDEKGFDVEKVEPGSPAEEAGILAGDIIAAVEGQSVASLGTAGARDLIRGKEGTTVAVTILREEKEITYHVERKSIQVIVASGTMLDDKIGLVKINNFDSRCFDETVAAIQSLLDQGAQALIFDVRNNPGGYKEEMVKILDYLLPEGVLFRSLTYSGEEETDTSDAKCLDLPFAVLVNENSYSAAEFFAAALDEYDRAVVVGESTTGKGYFQMTYRLLDGSAVGLSVGKYFTPKGVSLADAGGLKPEILVQVDAETAAAILAGQLQAQQDPQLQAARKALLGE